MFEWIYFANADSTIWNKNVYQMRLKFGEILGKRLSKQNLDIDIVVPVPDTARPSAITISEALKTPYREVLIKNRYTQRTFILNKQEDREKMVKLKLNVVASEVKGKNVLLVDDSIVRGTTSSRIIKLLKDNGAKNVYIASTCPPIIKPCYFGIDFPNSEELIAFNKTCSEISKAIKSDAVFYLEVDELRQAFENINTCRACVDGQYPIDTKEANRMINTRISHEKNTVPGFC
jgi:amidophosphoribosyltransferase